MANQEQVTLLKQGTERWNTWRTQHPKIQPDLYGADLTNADLREVDLRNANLVSANLRGADLRGTDLSFADLGGADLRGAHLGSADLRFANLTGAHLDYPGEKTALQPPTRSSYSSAQPTQTSIVVPSEIQRVATDLRMGAISNAFGYNAHLVRHERRAGYIALGAGFVFCLVGLASMAGGAAGWVFLILALPLLGASLHAFSWASRLENCGVRIYLCKKGFVYKNGNTAAQPFCWDQITAVWNKVIDIYSRGSYLRTIHKYTIERADGYKIVLDDQIEAIERVANKINEQTTLILLPSAIERYTQGQTVSFGPLSLNRQGLIKGQKVLPWQQIEAIDTKKGEIRVKQSGRHWSNWEDVSKVPNTFVFLNLVDSLLKQRSVYHL